MNFRLLNSLLWYFIMITVLPLWGQEADHVAHSQSLSSDTQKMDKTLTALIKEAAIPGMSIALMDSGKLVYSKAWGLKNNATADSINEQTIFEAASLTKPLVAYCALKMVEAGQIDLDMPLYRLLEYPDAADDDRYKLITARLVLSHASGFPNWRANRNGGKLKVKYDPGSKFGYSGEGFVYLQKVMEHLTGSDLQSLVSQYIFEPLGMTRSKLVFGNTTNYAVGHDEKGNAQKKFKPIKPNAAYSLHTTALDYLKFMQELADPQFMEPRFMTMLQKHHRLMNDKEPSLGWTLGLGINNTPDESLYWHWGDNGVFRAFFIMSVKRGKGLVYFTNSQNGLSIVHRIIQMTFNDERIMQKWQEYKQH